MSDKLEITLRIALDRSGLAKRLKRPVEDEDVFFVLGLVNAQLAGTFGENHCLVEMESASGVSRSLIEAMNVLPRRLRQTLQALKRDGEAVVTDPDVLAALCEMQDLTVTPMDGKWLVIRPAAPGDPSVTPGSKGMKH
ncbi:MAG TPA: hypothetical protein VGK74_26905 [Symbiobacteriaceae bacterium]|jgi:hypothetical protein